MTNALRMWTEMARAGGHLQEALLSTYKSKAGCGKLIDWIRFDPIEDDEDLGDRHPSMQPTYFLLGTEDAHMHSHWNWLVCPQSDRFFICLPPTIHLPSTYHPPAFHLPSTYHPPAFHLPSTYLLAMFLLQCFVLCEMCFIIVIKITNYEDERK